ncbi:hypothetical protein FRC02_010350 [Tulasnella sp. 418]|nr:hypothetical protein FRC02_010350 [Tulasnella sp. 418]
MMCLLIDLQEDCLIHVISFLGLNDIFSLRQTCKRLYAATRLRAVWVDLVQRCIINQGSPWPSNAQAITGLSAQAIESLALRCIRFTQRWDTAILRPIDAKHIRRPSGSTSWMTTYLSRWMIIGTIDCNILIWDLEHLNQEPVVKWTGLDGFVENGVLKVALEDATNVKLVVSTNTSSTYVFSVRFTLSKEAWAPKISQDSFITGYSTILAAQGELLAFGRKPEDNLPYILDLSTRKCARLQRHQETKALQYTIAIQIRSPVIIVAKTTAIELYDASVIDKLQDDSSLYDAASDLIEVQPMQRFDYPVRDVHDVRILDPCIRSFNNNLQSPIIISARVTQMIVHWELRRVAGSTDDSLPCYEMDAEPVLSLFTDPVAYRGRDTLTMCISGGSQGDKYIWAYSPHDKGRNELDIWGGSVRYPCRPLWVPPSRHVPDLPRLSIFDDCTGLVILAMASGIVWILDYGSNMLSASAEETTVESEIDNRTQYTWGGWNSVPMVIGDASSGQQNQEDFSAVDDWVWVSRRIEPEDPLPPPPGYPSWSPPLAASHNSRPTVDQMGTTAPLLHLPVAGSISFMSSWSFRKAFASSEQYGCAKWTFNQLLHIPGTPVMVHSDPSNVVIQIEGHYLRFDEGYPVRWFGYDASKVRLDEVLNRSAQPCGVWGGYGQIDTDRLNEVLAWDARQSYIQLTLGGEWELMPLSNTLTVL